MDPDPLFSSPQKLPAPPSDDTELCNVHSYLLKEDPEGRRTGAAIRRSFDLLFDGQHTGRFRWDQLHKTEKTYFGTLVEIGMQREFAFEDGEKLDFRIVGADVDCKYSQDPAKWMIPPEAVGKILLGLWASDEKGKWSMGLVRAKPELLSGGDGNRDKKRQLTRDGRGAVTWLFHHAPLPENALLRLEATTLETIFAPRYGTKRVDELFRHAQGRLISRNVVATVAMQEDYMKRLRANGGSRSSLAPEGIVVFGPFRNHANLAEQLGLPRPGRGEFISARLALRTSAHEDRRHIKLGGREWVVAGHEDPVVSAPQLPKVSGKEIGEDESRRRKLQWQEKAWRVDR